MVERGVEMAGRKDKRLSMNLIYRALPRVVARPSSATVRPFVVWLTMLIFASHAVPTPLALASAPIKSTNPRSSGNVRRVRPMQGPSLDSISPTAGEQSETLTVTLNGTGTIWNQANTTVSFGDGISVGGAASGTFWPVTVVNDTTITAQVTVSATAALNPRTVQATTARPDSNGGPVTVTLADAFAVNPSTALGSTAWTVTTIAGTAGTAGFADGPASQAQ